MNMKPGKYIYVGRGMNRDYYLSKGVWYMDSLHGDKSVNNHEQFKGFYEKGCLIYEGPIPGAKEASNALDIMQEGIAAMKDRASERDTESERSMAAAVKAFNAIYGTELTEELGWMFMVFLKASRSKGGDFRKDDYVDGAAYFALAGEAKGGNDE